jgi:YD repeat-containing protein
VTVSEIQGQGASLTVDAGATLTLSSTSTVSGVADLNVGYGTGSGTVSVADGLTIAAGLDWVDGTFSGGGTVTIGPAAYSEIQPGTDSDSITLDNVDLVNRGWVSAYCQTTTDTTNSMTLIQGEGGAKLDNEGSLWFDVPGGSGSAYGCEFQQTSGAPSTFENGGAIFWSGDDSTDSVDIGWVFDNSSVDSVINNAQIDVFGGESAPIGGKWNGASLNLESGGPYSITDDLADFGSQSAGQADVTVGDTLGSWDAPTTTFTEFLAGTSTSPSLTITGGDWTNGWVIANGPLTLGQTGQITTIGNLWNNNAAPITVNGTVNAASYSADDGGLTVADGGDFNVYGTTGLSGTETVSGSSGSTVDFEGAIDVSDTSTITTSGGLVLGGAVTGTGNLTINTGGPFWEQGGVSITGNLTVDSTDSADMQISGEIDATGDVSLSTGGSVDVQPNIDSTGLDIDADGGITIYGDLNDDTSISLTSAGNIVLAGQAGADTFTIGGGGTTTLYSTWVWADALTVNDELVDNEGTVGIFGSLEGEDGAQIVNDGLIQADDSDFTESSSGAPSLLTNASDGQLIDWDDPWRTNDVSIPYTGTGSVAPAYDLTNVLEANTVAPTITGTAQNGDTLTASTGTWLGSGLTYSYQWLRCDADGRNCSSSSGATSSTYLLTPDDVGFTIKVAVTGTNSEGDVTAVSDPTGVVAAGTSTTTFEYDSDGRLTQADTSLGG